MDTNATSGRDAGSAVAETAPPEKKKPKAAVIIIVAAVIILAIVLRLVLTPKNSIVGKWKMKGASVTGRDNASDLDVVKEFKADGTETFTIGTGGSTIVQQGTYTVSGDAVTETLHGATGAGAAGAERPHTSHFAIENGVLTFTITSGAGGVGGGASTTEEYERVE
jgi:uncharacterized protein (TIGR03066 family)